MTEAARDFGFGEIEKIFNGLEAIADGFSERRRDLTDQTGITIARYPSLDGLLSGDLIDTYEIRVSRGDFNSLTFVCTVNGLVRVDISSLDIKIGKITVPNFDRSFGVNYHGSDMPEDAAKLFRESWVPLIGWIGRMLEENHYLQPPFSITPSANPQE